MSTEGRPFLAAPGGGVAFSTFLHEEYKAYRQQINDVERSGEARVSLFLLLASAVLAAIGLKREELEIPERVFVLMAGEVRTVAVANPTVLFLLAALFLAGTLIFSRTVHRNLIVSDYKAALDDIRRYFVGEAPERCRYFVWRPAYREGLRLREILFPRKGGLIELLMLLNSLVFAALAGALTFSIAGLLAGGEQELTAALATVAAYPVVWAAQMVRVNRSYAEWRKNWQERHSR